MNILVTGGSGGLGEAIVICLAKEQDSKIYFTYNNSIERAAEIADLNKNCIPIKCDFRSEEEIEQLIGKMSDIDLNVLVNNAWSPMVKKHFHKFNPSYIKRSFSSNILPIVRITQKAFTIFRKKKSGNIINILSSAIINKPPVGWSIYTAEKNYLLSLSKSWATEGVKFNISSNCISPSMMLTKFISDIDERVLENVIAAHPRKELLNTEEVAEVVLSLTKFTKHLNGQNIIINAGSDVI